MNTFKPTLISIKYQQNLNCELSDTQMIESIEAKTNLKGSLLYGQHLHKNWLENNKSEMCCTYLLSASTHSFIPLLMFVLYMLLDARPVNSIAVSVLNNIIHQFFSKKHNSGMHPTPEQRLFKLYPRRTCRCKGRVETDPRDFPHPHHHTICK